MRFVFLLCTIAAVMARPAIAQPDIEEQRKAFRAAYNKAELGIWSLNPEQERQLSNYVLWPDLRATYMRATLRHRSDDELRAFLDEHGTLKPARELRYRYALHLARNDRLADYLEIYRQFYQGLEIAKLDCLALQGELNEGKQKRVINLGRELWLVGKSQVEECDPVFSQLRNDGALGTDLYRERFDLAIASRNFSLARYLAKSIGNDYLSEADLWHSANADRNGFITRHDDYGDSGSHRARVLYVIERVAMRDPQTAVEMWHRVDSEYPFTGNQRDRVERHLALWAARRHHPDAAVLLAALRDEAVDTEVLRWRARTALRVGDWNTVADSIGAMGDDQEAEEWQYWLSLALRRLGNESAGAMALQSLANERSFYGFLAADELGIEYAFDHKPLQPDPQILAALESRNSIMRARELFLVGLEGRGRSEWDAAIALLQPEEMRQAALLAHSWGWHSRAIATAARTGDYDDLDLRYPLPWSDKFAQHSKTARVRPSWAYGVARSESLFMRDVRSHAGAIGLMQLMPETGRETAQEVNLPFSGVVTLTNPDSNIRLGTTYLAKMYARFSDSQVLATAAYNAGPYNVQRWLPDSGEIDARIWIENIPYNETRDYVRRVLATDAIFHWRLSGDTHRVTTNLSAVRPLDRGRLASAQ